MWLQTCKSGVNFCEGSGIDPNGLRFVVRGEIQPLRDVFRMCITRNVYQRFY